MKDKDVFKLYNQIRDCDGAKFLARLKLHRLSHNVFRRNFKELILALQKIQVPSIIEQINNDKKGLTQDFLHEEIVRFFHNFLASAKTLVDHSRIFVEETYSETSFYAEYLNKVEAEFKYDGLATFIHDLRNYILHKGIPLTSLKTSIIPEKSIEKSILIDVVTLRKWKKWTKFSKDFISTLSESEKLLNLIEDYYKKVERFYQWFHSRLFELHDQDIKYLKILDSKFNKLTSNTGN